MLTLCFAIIFIAHSSFTLIKEETRYLSVSRVTEIGILTSSCIPKLCHAIQNDCCVSLLTTSSTEFTRTCNPNTNENIYSARYTSDNTVWDTRAAEKAFYELIAKYKLHDKTPNEILTSCKLSGKTKS